ncbi:glycosyltransferase [Larsenimonas rhizosphaerae]|uniref:glycosyltransferase n=1 Tax=Larsenimonas rhizosphaerae TaxID=2944682 RepID=UPI00203465EE|nr:glycosyltransferase [Larsenimonas rhizosphaerae]MCM2131841.1 glycosyltransferase [Larsenimonas rhizosphaerae]
MNEQQLVLVVGMHRSGTSAVCQLLEAMGVGFGNNLMPAAEENPRGFLEDLSLVAFNEQLLGHEIGWTLINPQCSQHHSLEWSSAATHWWHSFLEDNHEKAMVALKDPRICRTLSYWHPILGASARVVFVVRHPSDVAGSLAKRNGFDRQLGLALWFVYNYDAYCDVCRFGYSRLMVDYDQLIDEEERTGQSIAEFLGLPASGFDSIAEKGLRNNHQRASDEFELSQACEALYTALLSNDESILEQLASYHQHLCASFEYIDGLRCERYEANSQSVSRKLAETVHQRNILAADYAELENSIDERNQHVLSIGAAHQQTMDELVATRLHLEKQQALLDSVLASDSWKITAPLRYLGNSGRSNPWVNLVRHGIQQGGGVKGMVRKAVQLYRVEGVSGLKRGFYKIRAGTMHSPVEGPLSAKFQGIDRNDYAAWVEHFDTLDVAERRRIMGIINAWDECPTFSIIMPTFNPEPDMLRAAIDSVIGQLYPHWELCIADDASTDPAIRDILDHYARAEPRIKVAFREENGHISASSNSALALAKNEWVALFDHDDLLTEHALFYMAEAIRGCPDVKLLYSDEDKVDQYGHRQAPYFKPGWNRDLLYSQNFICHLGVYQRDIIERIGGFRLGLEGSQDHDLALRFIEQIEDHQVHHVPRVLYHWRMHAASTSAGGEAKPYTVKAGLKALNEHFQRTGRRGHVEATPFGYRARYTLPDSPPLVSLVIPTRNSADLVRMCIDSIMSKTNYPQYEILLVDNNSDDPEALAYFAELGRRPNIKVIRDEQPFNYSAINNDAVARASGEVIALVNNDIEVISEDWLTEMVSLALQPGVGAVGAKLLYPDDTIQHAGVVLGIGGVAGHSHKHFPCTSAGYLNRLNLISSYSAVTAACLVIRKSIYDDVGGLDEDHLKVAFNDVDFCLRVREAGYRNVWTPYAQLYHHESVSRGAENTPEKMARFSSEVTYMRERWGDLLDRDSAYNPNLSLIHEDFSLSWSTV